MTDKATQQISQPALEKPENAARPCLDSMPYRTLVFARLHSKEMPVPLYWVAGVNGGPWGATNSLKKAAEVHGANCFYCSTELTKNTATIDHVEGQTGEAANAIQNLVLACKPCNTKKGSFPIDAFKPEAGREWLSALLAQVQDRLDRLDNPEQERPA
ncbi:MAG TPA: HNH endonuclease signature motif containing protein [Sphingopyxis sp.]|jgi:5-methylcytosine-specific restriction endonuclease McrA|uniref:HNH endonuclease signature motif containing protein n=1 Tax=Sphingopyxis sp. TaxID=1908224 RepID=UPI002E32C66D|nr:HNH endonuclease signature motif containing protein [Sphingopyxis sp.]HEX2811642.1 HNH endonuclease signature motif containing protein [Sphingopyxis sp.]